VPKPGRPAPEPARLPASERCRCRQFPALINCCNIDWYAPWPCEALRAVALALLGSDDLSGGMGAAAAAAGAAAAGAAAAGAAAQGPHADLAGRVADMCVAVHISVQAAAGRMHQELRRRCGPACCRAGTAGHAAPGRGCPLCPAAVCLTGRRAPPLVGGPLPGRRMRSFGMGSSWHVLP
jgi:hypothetical protein